MNTEPQSARRLRKAQRKTSSVRDGLKLAGGELNLTKAVIEQELPPDAASDDLAHALAHQEVIEEKVMQAAGELDVVHGLLDEEVAERERLERELARTRREPRK